MRYEFETIRHNQSSDYIFQTISKRRLSNIYHSHDFYEWIIVLNGNCRQIVNEKQAEMKKNMCMLLCPGDSHCFTAQSEDVNVMALSISESEISRFEAVFDLEDDCLKLSEFMLSSEQVRELLNFYCSFRECEYKLLLANLIKLYIDNANGQNEVPFLIRIALGEMQKTENMKGGVERLAALSGYSRTHLNRLMKSHFGTSIHEYILNIRLEYVYNELILSNTDAETLSESVGYASFSHFNRIFKNKYGITPAEVRRKYKLWTT